LGTTLRILPDSSSLFISGLKARRVQARESGLNRKPAAEFLAVVRFDFVPDGKKQIEVQKDVDNGDEEDGPEEQGLDPFSKVEIGKRAKEGGKEGGKEECS